jgi:hypothetical protein
MVKKKKRKATARQLAALAKGRAKRAKITRKSPKRKTAPRKRVGRVAEDLKPLLISEGNTMATKRRTTRKKTAKRKTTRYHGEFMGTTKRKKTRRSPRRYSGMGGKLDIMKPLINTGIAVAGGVAGSFAANKLPIADARIKAAVPMALGLVLGMTKFGRKNAMVQAAASGMMVAGGLALLRQFAPTLPLLAGEEDVQITDETGAQLLGAPTLLGDPVNLGEDNEFDALLGDDFEDLEGGDYVTPASM